MREYFEIYILMQTTKFLNLDCVSLENESLSLLISQSAGPRVISLRFKGGENLFAELPDLSIDLPDGKTYHFYGGHRLWHAPESMPRTYALDDQPVEIVSEGKGLRVTQAIESETGIEKSIHISLVEDKPQVIIQHTLTNRSLWDIECAPWAVTQFKTSGTAILPQSQQQTELLPNRSLAIWPYTNVASPNVKWGNKYILLHADMKDEIFKIGFPNPCGWMAYWLNGTLFVKRAAYDSQAAYYDRNSSSECYCSDKFLELETLAPISVIKPDVSITHTETWEVFDGVDFPSDENAVDTLVEKYF
jgi:hypothetical protein